MKLAIHILLVAALAVGPWGCNRADAPDESVSANADRAERVDRAERAVEPEPRPAPAPATRARATENVPAGTALTVTLADGISTETNQEGDRFTAHLTQPMVIDGKVVAEKGATVTGHVKTIEEPGRVKGRARLELVLDDISAGNRKYNLDTEPFIVVAGDNKDRDAAIIAGGAGVGAVIGAVTGGKKGAALGAIIGGGSGTTAVMITKGEQLKLEPETRVNFVLSDDVNLPVIRNAIS